MSRLNRLALWLEFHGGDWLSDRLRDLMRVLPHRHEIVDDMCGRPEHRYCLWCGRGERHDG